MNGASSAGNVTVATPWLPATVPLSAVWVPSGFTSLNSTTWPGGAKRPPSGSIRFSTALTVTGYPIVLNGLVGVKGAFTLVVAVLMTTPALAADDCSSSSGIAVNTAV